MDNKDHTAAANALIQWFNSQEIKALDAEIVMCKALAVIIAPRCITTHPDHFRIEIDDHARKLTKELVDRAYSLNKHRRLK